MSARCMGHHMDHRLGPRLDHLGGHRRGTLYPGRALARLFGYVGIATLIYAAALVAVAVHSRILEF